MPSKKKTIMQTLCCCYPCFISKSETMGLLPSGVVNNRKQLFFVIPKTKIVSKDSKPKMADVNRKRLFELLKRPGNNTCVDCGASEPEWASYNLGIFLCTQCADFHRSLGPHISKVKSIRSDHWDTSQVDMMENGGNHRAHVKYEIHVPVCYRRPLAHDVQVLKEEWIRAKYEREEFIHIDKQVYLSGRMEGILWKRGKEDGRFNPRKFVLNEADDTLKYYVKEVSNKDIIHWYTAIRSAKLNRLQVAFPGTSELELARHLTRDFLKEGWLRKMGPRSGDSYKLRWCSLDDRKLMYLENPLDPYPKGEIFLGYHGYGIKPKVPEGVKTYGFGFTLQTPERLFVFGSDRDQDRQEWLTALQQVIDRPLTPQDNFMAANLVKKRSTLASSLQLLRVL
ncbi:arf-GAP with dual PH domain-containing protein 1-like [Limulus polyphemus]|uniref:Arf-GAP with dual PH domain-containing protein 1-like n=1 Tax=Limulus polyphemus TaxID=6850 RepID=A0ABM1BQ28_LIMPO|nr:arf-GAP with dual PH domain-containing protein 1-like [Limulus polyphemus]